MKNKYKIDQTVKIKSTGESLTIKDFEFISGIYVYYFDHKTCYPEHELYNWSLKDVLLGTLISKNISITDIMINPKNGRPFNELQ